MEDVDVDESEDRLIIVSAMLGHENAKVNRIETLYYADKEITEDYILDLLWALQDSLLENRACVQNIKKEQIHGEANIQVATSNKWKYEHGKPLVMPDLVKDLPTQMRRFHDWYMNDIYEIYHQDSLNLSLVSCWVLLEIQRCRKEGIYDVGFIDPMIVNNDNITKYPKATLKNLYKSLDRQHFRTYVLLPFHFGFHWILLVIDIKKNNIYVFDSKRGPQHDYQEAIDMINEACAKIRKQRPGLFKEKLYLRTNFPCLRQEAGNNLCGYYVCEFIHIFVGNNSMKRSAELMKMNDELLPFEKIKAIQEQLLGFINDEIINSGGEFHYDGRPLPVPINVDEEQ
ncbi:hypothetical protein U9M48_004784 [Paspalum notatum var. saurae]|uniref:Ubiquitin-like protease family profile domain-containing protein n=1 Tax=Paspalum notatum var. saurae TaxID=547442 RepID=A0AAQ3SJC4_PASNO